MKPVPGMTLSQATLTPPMGFALCCDVHPILNLPAQSATCPICNRIAGVWGGTAFLRTVWNTKQMPVPKPPPGTRAEHFELPIPTLYMREGWASCRVEVNQLFFGGRREMQVADCLFYCTTPQVETLYAHDEVGYACAIDEGRHLRDITVEHPSGRQLRLQWKSAKRFPYSYAYLSTGWCTDGTYSWNVTINSTRQREWALLDQWVHGDKRESFEA